MDGKNFGKRANYSPMDFNGLYANEVTIGESCFYPGQRFLYLFDFGDEWEFQIEVVTIHGGKKNIKAAIVETYGTAPEQY